MTYYPVILSKLGPLKAIECSINEKIVPLVELVNIGINRAGSKFGDAIASASAISENIGYNKFFLDIADNESYKVLSHDYLIRPENAYKNWFSFISQNFGPNCSPVVQFSPDTSKSDIRKQIDRFLNHFGGIGVRVPFCVEAADIENISNVLSDNNILKRTTFFVDIGQMNADQFKFSEEQQDWSVVNNFDIIEAISRIGGGSIRPKIVPLSNSFPKSIVVDVKEESKGKGFCKGVRRLTDRKLFQYIRKRFGNVALVQYGDYATINQEQSSGGRGWIPRVDITKSKEFEFFRQRTKSNMNKSLTINEKDLPENNAKALGIICRKIISEGKLEDILSERVKDIIIATAKDVPPQADAGFWKSVRMMEHFAKISNMEDEYEDDG